MLKVKFYPTRNVGGNQYISNMKAAVKLVAGVEVKETIKFRKFYKEQGFSWTRSDYIFVNWLENSLKNKFGWLCLPGVLIFFFKIFYFRLHAKKVIYVRHNLYPHGMKGFHAKLAKRIADLGESFCDEKASHSGHLLKSGYLYLPHPLYDLNELQTSSENYFIMFGRVAEYKNIAAIIEHWDRKETLLIAGPTKDSGYLALLEKLASNRNISFDVRFIPDDEAINLVGKSSGVILAHNDENMIVSGSFFYAATLGLPVYAIKSPFLEWVSSSLNYDGLELFNTPNQLVLGLGRINPTDRRRYKEQANSLFGDTAMSSKFAKLFNVK